MRKKLVLKEYKTDSLPLPLEVHKLNSNFQWWIWANKKGKYFIIIKLLTVDILLLNSSFFMFKTKAIVMQFYKNCKKKEFIAEMTFEIYCLDT